MTSIEKNQFLDASSPIFITGRGGSGTRLLSNVMLQVCVFMGLKLNHQGDSLDWLEVNRELIIENITIDNGSFTQEWKYKLIDVAETLLNQIDHRKYIRWGAKLPEFMLCIPELINTFPNAKVIHLIRHPVSLCNRRTHITSRWGNPIGTFVLENAYHALEMEKVKKKHINNAVSWYYQVEKMISFAASNLSKDQYLLIKFEDLIHDTITVQNKIFNFLDIEPLNSAQINIDPTRTKLEVPMSIETDEIWNICGEVAMLAGYDKYNSRQ